MKSLIPLLWLAVVLPGCSTPPAAPPVLRGQTMGTSYRIKLDRLPDGYDLARLQQEIDARLERVNQQMSTWRATSELSRFNQSRSLDWFPVSPALAEVVTTAKQVSRESGGAFDVTVGPLVNLWHFGPREAVDSDDDSIPTDKEIAAARGQVGDHLLEVRSDPPALRKKHPELYVDLSAIAKGYGVDDVSELLDSHGVKNYMVEIGGEVRTRGGREPGRPWRLGIETPTTEDRGLQTVVELSDAALATSGDYRNFIEADGKRFSHTIDPRTGRPVDHRLASVRVITESCMKADALATALMVLGPEDGYNWAVEHNVAVLMLVHDGDAFVEKSTPPFEAYRNQED